MAIDREKWKEFGRKMLEKGYSVNDAMEYIRRKATIEDRTASSSPTALAGTNDSMGLIKKYFPQQEWRRAYNVMMGESGGRTNAIGDTSVIGGVYAPSYGLFQIRGLPGRPPKEQLLDPEFNIKYAADLWKSQGWGPWTIGRKLGYAK